MEMSSITLKNVRVFRKERKIQLENGVESKVNDYYLTASTKKDESGNRKYASMSVEFAKCWKESNPQIAKQLEICDKAYDFDQLSGFFTCVVLKDGTTKLHIVITK